MRQTSTASQIKKHHAFSSRAFTKTWYLGVLLCLPMPACSGGHGATGKLYVTLTNATGSSILRFNNASSATGNVAPAASISGSATTLNNPLGLSLDVSNNRLYVANNGAASVVIYDAVSTVTGNSAPTRTIAGSSTALSAPVGVTVDTSKNVLYVADSGNLLIFSSASTANGNIAPTSNAQLGFVASGLLDDPANDRLYVASGGGNSIAVYDNASTISSGAVSASRTITGASTLLSSPSGLVLDPSGRLVVSNASGSSITMYSNAASASGNVAPSATISGSATTLIVPQQIALSSASNGILYAGDGVAGEVAIFGSLMSANGNVAPTRNISGSNTGLSANSGLLSVRGVALDPTR